MIGGVGLSPKADAIVRPLVDAADLIVLAGYDPIEMRQGWRHPWPEDKRVIDIVAEPLQHGMHAATMILEGEVGAILTSLADGLPAKPSWPGGEPQAVRDRLRAAFAAPSIWGPTCGVPDPARGGAGRDVVATADSGAHRILL